MPGGKTALTNTAREGLDEGHSSLTLDTVNVGSVCTAFRPGRWNHGLPCDMRKAAGAASSRNWYCQNVRPLSLPWGAPTTVYTLCRVFTQFLPGIRRCLTITDGDVALQFVDNAVLNAGAVAPACIGP